MAWIDTSALPEDKAEVVVCMTAPHHGKTVLASRFLKPYQGPFGWQTAGFCWGGGFLSLDEILCWQPVPQDPRLSEA